VVGRPVLGFAWLPPWLYSFQRQPGLDENLTGSNFGVRFSATFN
jgi:hypothetical protein